MHFPLASFKLLKQVRILNDSCCLASPPQDRGIDLDNLGSDAGTDRGGGVLLRGF